MCLDIMLSYLSGLPMFYIKMLSSKGTNSWVGAASQRPPDITPGSNPTHNPNPDPDTISDVTSWRAVTLLGYLAAALVAACVAVLWLSVANQ